MWLGECNSSRPSHTGRAEPEIWFRIVHVAADHPGAPGAIYREQAAEIALRPNGALENGRTGIVTHRVQAERVVTTMPARRAPPKPPRAPKTPRVVKLLRKAIEWQGLLESREVRTQAEIPQREGITRARVTQVMGLLRLARQIQEHVLSFPDMLHRPAITERASRPIAQPKNVTDQKATFEELTE